MSNEKPSDTNETGTAYGSTSAEKTEHQVKSSVKKIKFKKREREITVNNTDLFLFLLIKYGL